MLLWEELPSAQATDVQAIFLYDERCRLAGDLVQASARQAALVFAFRPSPLSNPHAGEKNREIELGANQRVTLIATDMAAGLRLIYTSAPGRLRHIAARAQQNSGLLPSQARGMPAVSRFRGVAARVRLLLRQARADTRSLSNTLAQSGERFDAPDSIVAASTVIWRLGIALGTLLQSGRESSLEFLFDSADKERESDALAAVSLARSVVRPDNWSSRAPVQMADLLVFSGDIEEHFIGSLDKIVSEMRRTGLSESVIRSLLGRRQVPLRLLSNVLKDSPSPWRKQ